MSDFDLQLKRGFAEIADPAEDGFTVALATKVARKERFRQARAWLGGIAAASGGAGVMAVFAKPLTQALAPVGEADPAGFMTALSNGALTWLDASGMAAPFLFLLAASAGGAVAYLNNARD